MKEFDPAELELNDGKEERPVYVAHQGKVYDVSESKLWKGGLHMRRHHAGRDLTTDISSAPHGPEVLERYPQIGALRRDKEPAAEQAAQSAMADLLKRYPMLRRHPHPMTVHFPIVFMLSCPAFHLLYLLTGARSLESTALHCLAAGILFLPIVMVTGLFSWWLNYMAKPFRAVKVKLLFSLVMFLVALTAFMLQVAKPDIPGSFSLNSIAYSMLVFSLAPLVLVIGWFGAKLTFPLEKE